MALKAKERRELVGQAMEHLQNVIGASGRAEELVRLTTQIVQNGKKLSEGIPEGMRTRSTASLAEFVIAARAIAKDARAVDSTSLQKLGRTKRAVESLIQELDEWHASQAPQKKDEIELALENIVPEPSKSKSRPGGSSPPQTPVSEREKKLTEELKKQQKRLMNKMDPQTTPEQHGRPEDILKMAVTGLGRSSTDLMEQAGQKSPTKELLLEPMILMSRMVAMLMDLVDSLYVSKYPMRAQVHSFCCTLIENVLVYGSQSKSDDAASLRIVCMQCPALLNAVEVMVEQCTKRLQDVEKSREMSIQRKVDLRELDVYGPGPSPGSSPKAPRKRPHNKKGPPKEKEGFEIHCVVCTIMAVDNKTKEPVSKGTELTLNAMPTTTIFDVRGELSALTGLPIDHIELKFQGDDVLPDAKKVTPNNPVPYFMFNLCEPSEKEVEEIKKVQKRRNRITIMNSDWSKLTGPVAVAMYDYEALGEEGNLEFDEGDIIEIIQKSADGWWTGRLDDKTGDFPASFVEEVQAPRTKEEHKKLVKMFKKRDFGTGRGAETQAETISFDDDEDSMGRQSSRSLILVTPSGNTAVPGVAKEARGALRRGSDSPPKANRNPVKFNRRTSEPVFSEDSGKQSKSGGQKKKSLFKKRPGTQYSAIPETDSTEFSFIPNRSPILSRKKPASSAALSDTAVSNGVSSELTAGKPLVRPASSPRVAPKVPLLPPNAGGRSPNVGPRRRPPPPPPPPYARTHGRKGLTDLLERRDSEEIAKERSSSSESSAAENAPDSPPSTSPPLTFRASRVEEEKESTKEEMKEEAKESTKEGEDLLLSLGPSNSMEELLKNLEEFDAGHDEFGKGGREGRGDRDYATIPRSELPVREEKKISESEAEERSTSPSIPKINVTTETEAQPKPLPSRPQRRPKPKVQSASPQPPESPKPTLPPRPVENGYDRLVGSQPTPPPRVKRGRMSQKAKETQDQAEKEEEEAVRVRVRVREGLVERPQEQNRPERTTPTWVAPPPPARPPANGDKRKKKHRSMLEAYDIHQPVSAPVSRTGSPDDHSVSVTKLSKDAWASTDALGSNAPSRSPVVQRRTTDVVPPSTPEPFSDDELEDCTGIGKEGVLHKEGTSSHDWKARYFRLLDNKLTYYKTDSAVLEDAMPLGQIQVNRMQAAVPLGRKNSFLCFAVKMKYETSVVLGAHTQTELDDWVRSINKMIKGAKATGGGGGKRGVHVIAKGDTEVAAKQKRQAPSYATAMWCITYLLEGDRTAQDRVLVSGGGSMGRVNRWLGCINYGDEPDLTDMPDAATAVSLLKMLFTEERLGALIPNDTAKELCDKLRSASPVSVLKERLDQQPSESRALLKQILRLFGQVMEQTDRNHTDVGDLNKVFGPLLFDNVATVQSEPLLAYLISTCELVLS